MVFDDFQGAAYLRLRGLPFSASAAEIVSFFDGFDLSEDHVLLGMNHEGRPSGEAWVQFPDEATAEMARNHKDRQQLGTRYIEIFPSCYEDCKYIRTAKLNSGLPQPETKVLKSRPGAGYIRLRGLPFYAGASEVAEFFSDYGIRSDQVVMGTEGATGRPSGEAWVQFSSEAVAAEARSAKDRQRMGSRYIEIFASSEEEAAKASSRPTQDSRFRAPGDAPAPSAGYGKGLPAAYKGASAMAQGPYGMGMPVGKGMPMGMGMGMPMDWSAWFNPMAWGAASWYGMAGAGAGASSTGKGPRYSPY